MNKIRFFIALWISKLSIIALKLTGHNGTNFPGRLALKICPKFLQYISKPKTIIGVTGTNGKTTVNNLIADTLNYDKRSVLDNRLGSNTDTGISTALINGVNIFNKEKYSIATFEIDERSAVRIYPHVTPTYLLITNLTRDSIMRNGHPEFISNVLTKNIPKETKLVLNAEDLISDMVSPNNDRIYYGIDKMDSDVTECINLINDMQICPKCSYKLKYNYLRYHHIGNAYCPNCGFKSPKADYQGKNVDLKKMTIDIKDHEGTFNYRLLNDSVFNIYNVVCTVALLRDMGYTPKRVQELLNKIEIVKSRYNVTEVNGVKVIMLLSKDRNALGSSRAFDYAVHTKGNKKFILMMNNMSDEKVWSENVCWLYDCDFEFLNRKDIEKIVVTGPRFKDYKLRLLLAGVKEENVLDTHYELDSPELLEYNKGDVIYLLYGTDNIDLATSVRDKIVRIIKEGK